MSKKPQRILPQKESKASYGAQRGRQSGFSARGGPPPKADAPREQASGWALPIAILIVVVLIVAGGAGYYSYTSYKAYREIKKPEIIKPEQTDSSLCEKITEHFRKGGCYFKVATENKDSSLCKKTTDEAACYQNIAIATKDVGLCEKIIESTSKDGCYYLIAIEIKNDILCERIMNNIHKLTCHAIVKNDSAICEEITDSYGKQICYKNFTERAKTEEKEEKVELKKEELQKKDVIAIVNGVEITKDEFIQRLRLYIQSNESQMRQAGQWQRADETEDEFIQRLMPIIGPTIGKGILEYMITEIIFQQKAKEQNITVRPEEIDKKIVEFKPKPTAENLSKMGMTMEDLRKLIASQIIMEKIVAKSVIVTEKEIRDYFESHKANFAKPEEIKASHILLRTEEEAKEVLSQLKAGADFAELAREKSIDPSTKDKGGGLGFFSRGKMTPVFEEAAFALKVGEISEVVKTPYGYHIIKVEERKPAQEPNLELAREEIEKTLTEQKTMTMRSNLLQNLRKEAQIEIILPELGD